MMAPHTGRRRARWMVSLTLGGLALAALGCGSPAVRLHEGVTLAEFQVAEGFDWVRDTVGPIVVYAERDSYPAHHFGRVREGIEAVPARIEEIFGRSLPPEPIHVFVLGSNEAMERLIGWRGNAMYLNTEPSVVLGILREDWQSLNEHEFFHHATRRLFGVPTGYGGYVLNEGVAVYASGRWRGYDLHALTHHLRRTGRGLTLQQLSSIERGQELLVYPQAGSFVRFLRERYGAERLSEYLERQYGSAASELEAIYHRTLAELEAEWNAVVEAADPTGIEYPIEAN